MWSNSQWEGSGCICWDKSWVSWLDLSLSYHYLWWSVELDWKTSGQALKHTIVRTAEVIWGQWAQPRARAWKRNRELMLLAVAKGCGKRDIRDILQASNCKWYMCPHLGIQRKQEDGHSVSLLTTQAIPPSFLYLIQSSFWSKLQFCRACSRKLLSLFSTQNTLNPFPP